MKIITTIISTILYLSCAHANNTHTHNYDNPQKEEVVNISDITTRNQKDGRQIILENNLTKAPLNGTYRIVNTRKNRYTIAEYNNGMYNGIYKLYKRSNLTETGQYSNGTKHGIFKYYHNNKLRKSQLYNNGKKTPIPKK